MRFVTFAIVVVTLICPFNSSAGSKRVKSLNKGRIIKEIDMPRHDPWAYVNVEAVIDSPPEYVWDALTHIGRWPNWMPMSRSAGVLSAEAKKLISVDMAKDKKRVMDICKRYPNESKENVRVSSQFIFEEYDLPWPLDNEFIVREYNYDENGVFCKAAWRRIDSKEERKDGYWQVMAWNDGKTLLKYYYRVKPSINVPPPIFRAAVSMTINSMIKSLRKEAARLEEEMKVVGKTLHSCDFRLADGAKAMQVGDGGR